MASKGHAIFRFPTLIIKKRRCVMPATDSLSKLAKFHCCCLLKTRIIALFKCIVILNTTAKIYFKLSQDFTKIYQDRYYPFKNHAPLLPHLVYLHWNIRISELLAASYMLPSLTFGARIHDWHNHYKCAAMCEFSFADECAHPKMRDAWFFPVVLANFTRSG